METISSLPSHLAVVVVTNTFRKLTKRDWLAVPFIVAIVLAMAVAGAQNALGEIIGWVVAFLNGCLLFCTALGLQETITSGTQGQLASATREQREQRRNQPLPFFSSWLPKNSR
jgi:lysylphosphatidylglycerol synthetase-like protein (DUF2156 family)